MRNKSRRFGLSEYMSIGVVPPLSAACAANGTGSPTSPSLATSTSSALGVTTCTYTTDVRPILNSDYISCHGNSRQEKGYNFTTYQGVLRAMIAGSDRSPLIKATGSRGILYGELSLDLAQKSQILYDWVVNSRAAE